MDDDDIITGWMDDDDIITWNNDLILENKYILRFKLQNRVMNWLW